MSNKMLDVLIKACHDGAENVKSLLESKGDLTTVDMTKALYNVAFEGHIGIAKLLIEHKADMNADDVGPLSNACRFGHIEMVQTMLDHKADVHGRFDMPLRWAHDRGYKNIVRLLLQHGADYNCIWHCCNQHVTDYIVLPLLHERLKRYEHESKNELLDMKKTLYDILSFNVQ